MRKSIELGRAVLSLSTADVELWLRTLITISPQQQCTNLESHNATSLLRLLSSGEVWVDRGNGLFIDLDLTLRGQPLPHEQLQQLSEAILQAPAWAQLNLSPSLPYDAAHELGRLRVLVSHSGESATPAAKPRHRVLSNTSAAGVRPPEGVSTLSLDSVNLCMDVFELKSRRNTSTAKRLKTSTNSDSISQSNDGQSVDNIGNESMDVLLSGADPKSPTLSSSSTLKRLRPLVSHARRTANSPVPVTPPNGVTFGLQLTSQGCNTQKTQVDRAAVEPISVQTLIDGALRLSILSNINSKMLPGIKVKANTFGTGLADIAPTLWKPGYLLSLSQRAHLLPAISRSLCQPEATTRTASISLKRKLAALAARLPPHQTPNRIPDREPAVALDASRMASSIAPHLWLHLQKHTPCKSSTSLESFVAAEPHSTPPPDDILEKPWKETEGNRTSEPSSVGFDEGRASNVDQCLEGCPTAIAACGGLSSRPHLLSAVVTPEFILDVGDDEILLGGGCLEGANLLALHGSELS